MKRLFLVGSVIASSLFFASCSTNGLATLDHFQASLKDRGCGSNGDITIGSATVTSLPTVNGHYDFHCPMGPGTVVGTETVVK